MEKICYAYVVFRGQKADGTGTTDIGFYVSGSRLSEKRLMEGAWKDFEKQGSYSDIMIHTISELSESLYNQLTSEMIEKK